MTTPKTTKKKPARKAPHTSAALSLESRSGSWVDALSESAFINFPERDAWRQRLIHTLLEWAEKEDSLEIMQFCIKHKLPFTTLNRWFHKYDDIKAAYNLASKMIACHRHVGSMTGKLTGGYAYRDIHMYDPDKWLAVNKYHADLKKETDSGKGNITVVYSKPDVVSKEELKEINEAL